MKRVTGIGGVFLEAKDPKALGEWYRRHLGIPVEDGGGAAFRWQSGDNAARCWHHRVEPVCTRLGVLRTEHVAADDQLPRARLARLARCAVAAAGGPKGESAAVQSTEIA
jgi:hypothetical protein